MLYVNQPEPLSAAPGGATTSSAGTAAPTGTAKKGFWLWRVLLAALIALASINIFTGAPVLALWIGSRVQGGGGLSTAAVFAVIATLAAAVFALTKVLAALGRAYDSLSGRPPRTPNRAAWLRSMRDEPRRQTDAADLTALEKALVVAVVLAVLAFEGCFIFLAGSALPNGS